MKIGLPTSLIYPYYASAWKTFFEELGMDVVESESTNKQLLNLGVKHAVQEICVPIKIYFGHLLSLAEKGVDKIYIPRMVSIRKFDTFCPKFLGMPDMARHALPGMKEKVLSHYINSKDDMIMTPANYFDLGMELTGDKQKTRHAIKAAAKKWKQFRELTIKGLTCDEANSVVLKGKQISPAVKTDVTIGVIGYVYNVYDPLISMNIVRRLRDLGVAVKTFEMLSDAQIEEAISHYHKPTFWTFTRKIMGAAYHYFGDKEVDGVIHMTAFGCGPDSFLGKLLELDSGEYGKPFMTMRLDEHTGEGHLQTRIEAFADMIVRKKRLVMSNK